MLDELYKECGRLTVQSEVIAVQLQAVKSQIAQELNKQAEEKEKADK